MLRKRPPGPSGPDAQTFAAKRFSWPVGSGLAVWPLQAGLFCELLLTKSEACMLSYHTSAGTCRGPTLSSTC